MKIPASIDFSDTYDRKIFDENSKEYKALSSLVKSGEFKEYQNQQLIMGVSVRYDMTSDVFTVQPDKFQNNELKEGLELSSGDDIDIESDYDELDKFMSDDDGIEDEELVPSIDPALPPSDEDVEAEYQTWQSQTNEPENNNQMQVVSLDDVMSIIQQVLGNGPGAPAVTASMAPVASESTPEGKSGPLEGGKEALKKVYFQGSGNETLDSDFEALYNNIQNLESHISGDNSYANVINANPSLEGAVEQPGLKVMNSFEDTVIEPQAEIVNMNAGAYVAKYGQDQEPGYYEDSEEGLMGPDRLVSDLPASDDDIQDYDSDDEGKEFLLDIEEDEDIIDGQDEDESSMMEAPGDENYKHPDLDRFSAVDDYSPEEESFDVELGLDELFPAYEEPMTPKITANKQMNIGGQQVQIILTGVMITAPELNYIGESVSKMGNKLKCIHGKDNEINIIVEANNKQYTINYTEEKRNVTKTPFSIKNKFKFSSLEEALSTINYKRVEKEAKVFKKIMSKDVINRGTNNFKDADILKEFKDIKNISAWNVKSVGFLNLKNGLNETFSRITQTGKESNTLVKDENNNFYLIKGNLKERSKIGTVKELIDLKEKKNYGNVEVVRLYENTDEGLGEIMYDIKRTSVPLLVWK